MADIENMTEINENFDTVKTLLNSIRAQGILNTSDVDKLLSGINAKLEKINTEEDIDIIKVFLNELKQNLDERHNVLISKFGAIEALFSNLLKNSNELPKSSELKELFDIVATNLSVFSREVVAQKESITDISLRLDAIRSDDSQKKDIIKNITLLKPDLERLNNGFDTIVISLNDNFKTLAKTISSLDKTDQFERFSDNLNNIEMSSNALLSALQLLDKKTSSVEESVKFLATKQDLEDTGKHIEDLRLLNQSINDSVNEINRSYTSLDNLADKIDASVNIIASLKTALEDSENQSTKTILENISKLEDELKVIQDDTEFNEFKTSLVSAIRDISEKFDTQDSKLNISAENITTILENLKALDVNTNFSAVISAIGNSDNDIKTHIDDKMQSFTTLSESNLGKIIDNISTSADSLNTQIHKTQSEITEICEGRFNTVFQNIADLRKVVTQLDENEVSANNAMFSNISDRLNLFETALKESLETQELTTNEASAKLTEQVENIKNLSGVLDYKMDSSVVEISNMTRMFETLKTSVDGVLALNFVETVKDLRADIYASKQDMANAFEASGNELAENIANDIYGKYELIISKLDSVEEDFKKTQLSALNGIREITEKISASLVDIISYVSESKELPLDEIDKKIEGLSNVLKESNLNYVESVRDVVDIIRVQVENNLKDFEEDTDKRFDYVNHSIEVNTDELKNRIQTSHEKLLEIQNLYNEIKNIIDVNNADNTTKYEKLFTNVNALNSDFDGKLLLLKNTLLDKIAEFKTELTCKDADKISDFKLTVESSNNKSSQEILESLDGIKSQFNAFAAENGTTRTSALEEINNNFGDLKSLLTAYSLENSETRTASLEKIYDNFEIIKTLINNFSGETSDERQISLEKITNGIDNIKFQLQAVANSNSENNSQIISKMSENYEGLKGSIEALANQNNENNAQTLLKMSGNYEGLKGSIEALANQNNENNAKTLLKMSENYEGLKGGIEGLANQNNESNTRTLLKMAENYEGLKGKITELAANNNVNNSQTISKISENFDNLETKLEEFNKGNNENNNQLLSKIYENYDELKTKIEELADDNSGARTNALAKLLENFVGLKEYIQTLNSQNTEALSEKTVEILESFNSVKAVLNKVDENVDSDMTRQLSIIESNFESLVSQMTILNEKSEQNLIDKINREYNNISERMDENVTQKLEEYKTKIEETFDNLSLKAQTQSEYLQDRIADINSALKTAWIEQAEVSAKQIDEISDKLKSVLDRSIETTSADYLALKDKLDEFTNSLNENNETLTQNLRTQLDDMTRYVDSIIDIQTQESDAHIDEFEKLIESLNTKLFTETDELKNRLNDLSDSLGQNSGNIQQTLTNLSNMVQDNSDSIIKVSTENSAAELKAVEEAFDKVISELESEKQTIASVKDFISDAMQNKLTSISENIEKETDVIVKELVEQFELLKKSQQDISIQITSGIESIVENQIFNNIEDLKSYLDIRTDSSVMTDKLDNLKLEITSTLENVISDMNKMLKADVFTSALSDYRVANEILINSSADRINEKIAAFMGDSAGSLSELIGQETQNIENKLAIFDKKFIDTIVDKFEEVKLLSNKYNDSFNEIEKSINEVLSDFQGVKGNIDSQVNSLIEMFKETAASTNSEIRQLNDCFENLRKQISNKSFDEAFQASINKQISSLESLIKEQMANIEDISDVCSANLPDMAELHALVKGSVISSLKSLTEKTAEISAQLENQKVEEVLEDALKNTKADIITQFLNIFNQISFVAEQEEIIDYIQNCHDELITVLSHIVTTTSDISAVKDNVTVVNDKIDSIRDEINLINEKITSIMSSDGYVDYVYSLQDLESDIANLRVVLKDMQNNSEGYSSELNNLLTSTENVYKLVESIKEDLPDKKSFENLTEDIVSISTRTNKLILASDESYKTLQDNLQDFKLVINDLDERTRNFAEESGMNRIDSKLNALNTLVQNGAKTNQVFNQVFEYLAEWVDNAGNQINAISSKVDTLDEIEQIKAMLADLKAEAEDNSDNVELIQALSDVFDKQAKRISTMEAKLDKIIVDNAINNKDNKLDMQPMEDTLNKFLAAIGDKISSQQEKINSLESTMEKIVDILDEKDTAQLTKKVGGMDRQIAKLNKSIEKIASHVVEK